MKSLHPDWHATDEESVPVRAKKSSTPSHAQVVSRRPAAIVGILFVAGIGFVFFHGVHSLTGQLAGDFAKSVRITEGGIEPTQLEVAHGETVTFTNEANIPHIIESDSLCMDTGFCLHTQTLFTGDSDNFTITQDIPEGTYDYFSSTSEGVFGQIIVLPESKEDTTVEDFPDYSQIAQDDFSNGSFFAESTNATDTVPVAQDNAHAQIEQNTATATTASMQVGIPRNPYTVGSNREHPFQDGKPRESIFSDSNNSHEETESFLNGHGPLRQPDTGTGIWIVVLCSIIGLFLTTRNYFVQL